MKTVEQRILDMSNVQKVGVVRALDIQRNKLRMEAIELYTFRSSDDPYGRMSEIVRRVEIQDSLRGKLLFTGIRAVARKYSEYLARRGA